MQSTEQDQMNTFDHSQLSNSQKQNISQCPFMKKQMNSDKQQDIHKFPFKNSPQQLGPQSSGGGCPFLQSTFKNPPLEHYPFNYDIPYQSFHEDIYQQSGGFTKQELRQKRSKFNAFPIYLLNTLQQNEPAMQKIRNITDVSQKFFFYDDFREEGNKFFIEKQYRNALQYYERAMGCFKYLSLKYFIRDKDHYNQLQKEKAEKDKIGDQLLFRNQKGDDFYLENDQQIIQRHNCENNVIVEKDFQAKECPQMNNKNKKRKSSSDSSSSASQSSSTSSEQSSISKERNKSRDKFNFNKLFESQESLKIKSQSEIKQLETETIQIYSRYASMMTIYIDENVVLHDGDDCAEELHIIPLLNEPNEQNELNIKQSEKTLRESLLVTIYLNMASCYLHMGHFQLARAVMDEAHCISQDLSSVVLFKKAQSILFDEGATLQQLEYSRSLVVKAMEVQKTEKAFKQTDKIQELLNVANAKQMYQETLGKVDEITKVRRDLIQKDIQGILLKTKELVYLQNILQKHPYQQKQLPSVKSDQEIKDILAILGIMVQRYKRMIEYFRNIKKEAGCVQASKQLSVVTKTQSKIKHMLSLEFKCQQQSQVMQKSYSDQQLNENNMQIEIIQKIATENSLDLNDNLTQCIAQEQQKDFILRIFESAELNEDILMYANNELLERKAMMEEAALNQQKQKQKQNTEFCQKEKQNALWNKGIERLHNLDKMQLGLVMFSIFIVFLSIYFVFRGGTQYNKNNKFSKL